MCESIFLAVDINGDTPMRYGRWKSPRKHLVYTSEKRAIKAMEGRGYKTGEYKVIEYVPKEGE